VSIVDDISTAADSVQDSVGLLGEIDLETNVVSDLVSLFGRIRCSTRDWNDGNEIYESRAAFSVIDQARLAFFVGDETLFEMCDSIWGSEAPVFTFLNTAIRRLQEATVAAKDFAFLVASECTESRRDVDYRGVMATDIDDDERAGHVYWPKGESRIRTSDYSSHDRENIKARSRVDRETKS